MRPLILELELDLGRRGLRWLMVGALMLWASRELQSESVTLSTYYPAPGGVYGNLMTTGGTTLARDSGSVVIGGSTAGTAKLAVLNGRVGIGTTSPSFDFHVQGSISVDESVGVDRVRGLNWHTNGSVWGNGLFNYGISREPGAWNSPYPDLAVDFHTGVKLKAHGNYGGVSIWDDWCDTGMDSCATGGSGYGSEIARFRTSAYGGTYIGSRVGLGSVTSPTSALDVGGGGIGVFRQPAGYCRQLNYSIGSGAACFTGSEYITMQGGVMSRYAAGSSGGSGAALCCGCPYGAACPSLP